MTETWSAASPRGGGNERKSENHAGWPHIAALPEWLRLQGTERPDMEPAEAEWCAMHTAAAAEIERLRAENYRLRAAVRVNALRWRPELSHAEIDREIERVAGGAASPRLRSKSRRIG